MINYQSQGIESSAAVFDACDYIFVDDAADGTDSFSASLFDSPRESFESSFASPVLTCVVKNEEDDFIARSNMRSFELDQQQGLPPRSEFVPQTNPNSPTDIAFCSPHRF